VRSSAAGAAIATGCDRPDGGRGAPRSGTPQLGQLLAELLEEWDLQPLVDGAPERPRRQEEARELDEGRGVAQLVGTSERSPALR